MGRAIFTACPMIPISHASSDFASLHPYNNTEHRTLVYIQNACLPVAFTDQWSHKQGFPFLSCRHTHTSHAFVLHQLPDLITSGTRVEVGRVCEKRNLLRTAINSILFPHSHEKKKGCNCRCCFWRGTIVWFTRVIFVLIFFLFLSPTICSTVRLTTCCCLTTNRVRVLTPISLSLSHSAPH